MPRAIHLRRDPEGADPSAQHDEPFDSMVRRLIKAGAGRFAPRVGSTFPNFALPDGDGHYVSLADILRSGPAVLSFNRGGWCHHCLDELSAWEKSSADLTRLNARLVSFIPELQGRVDGLRDMLPANSLVLCDVDHGLALQTGLAFCCDPAVKAYYLAQGLDLSKLIGSDSWFMTIPATFALDRKGVVTYAFVNPDFRKRASPSDVLASLRIQRSAPSRGTSLGFSPKR